MRKRKHIHFVGIKGVGVAPLAIIAKQAGFVVSGCDIDQEFITDEVLQKAGIVPLIGFTKDHLHGADVVVTTGAHGGFDNIEVKSAQEEHIKILTQGEAVGAFMDGSILGRQNLFGISIAGSHGKTTTTGMLATILTKNKLDPSFIVGTGDVPSLGSSGHYGKGKYFIAEADEYATEPVHNKKPKFLWQHPSIAIFTNIELDHPDMFASVDQTRDAFLQFTKNISLNGVLIANGDDPQTEKLLKEYTGRVVTFGYSKKNDFVLTKVSVSIDRTFFWAESHGASLGEFVLGVLGEHNAQNGLAAVAASLEIGLPLEKIKSALQLYVGCKRRFEFVGIFSSGGLLFDDYAHHPTEIKKTLQTFRQVYPKKKIICIFQPHTYSRTKKLFEQFTHSFSEADTVIITNIYPSLREKPDPEVSSEMLVSAMSKFHKEALFLPEHANVVKYIMQTPPDKNTVVITMGAGDIYKLKSSLI